MQSENMAIFLRAGLTRAAAAALAVLASSLAILAPVSAQDGSILEQSVSHALSQTPAPQRRVVIKPISQTPPSVRNIHRVVAAKTPSGFEVPRYVSLKFGKINGRAGPSQNHPIVWQYRRTGLPVIVIAETENWRKVRDITGDESWVYRAGLSGERHVLALRDTPIQKKPNSGAFTVAIAEKHALLRLEKCEQHWCRVFSAGGHRGWINRYDIWGTTALYE